MKQTSLAAIETQFDGFLIDQFGVLLDGKGCYPWAPAALSHLARLGKPIVLLSNSGKRAEPNAARLGALGFARESYLMVLSSGEAAHGLLSRRIGQDLPKGARVWLHARDGDTSAIDGLGLHLVDHPAEADLLVLAGSQADQITPQAYERLLAPAARRGVPMICTNPDLEMLTPQGLRPGAGAIAQGYAALGGPLELIGKPYRAIYAEAARLLAGIAPGRILCIGDSPAHDILGGQNAGHQTALVRTGLHAGLSDAALATLCAAEAMPDFILPAFCYSEDPPCR